MHKNHLYQLIDNSKNLMSRSKNILDKKHEGTLKRARALNNLKNKWSSLDEKEVVKAIENLINITQRNILVPVNLLISVAENHMTISKNISDKGDISLRNEFAVLMTNFTEISNKLNETLKPNIELQISVLHKAKEDLSLISLRNYLNLVKVETQLFIQIHKESIIKMDFLYQAQAKILELFKLNSISDEDVEHSCAIASIASFLLSASHLDKGKSLFNFDIMSKDNRVRLDAFLDFMSQLLRAKGADSLDRDAA